MVAEFYAAPPFSGTQKGMTPTPFAPTQPLLINDRSLKVGRRPTRLLPHAKILLVSIIFFSLLVRLCSGRFYIFTEQM